MAKDIKQENVKYIESIEGQYFLVKSSTIGKRYKVNLGNENIFVDMNVMLGIDRFFHASILFLYLSIFLSSDGNHYQSPTKLHHTLT